MKSSALGAYKGMYTKIFAVYYLMMLLIEYQMIYYRFYKDIFNKDLAVFHIKEFLILKILVILLEIIDAYSFSTTEIAAQKEKAPPARISKETPAKLKVSKKQEHKIKS